MIKQEQKANQISAEMPEFPKKKFLGKQNGFVIEKRKRDLET